MAASTAGILAGALGLGVMATRQRSNSLTDKSFDETTKRHWDGYQATHIPSPKTQPRPIPQPASPTASSSTPSSANASPSSHGFSRSSSLFDASQPQAHQMFFRGYRSSSFSDSSKSSPPSH
eukprot:m.476038 g.476038  ORF g.476038 m.476038 type:complete len:122 (+) comp20411_c0_seq1:252-617(+)